MSRRPDPNKDAAAVVLRGMAQVLEPAGFRRRRQVFDRALTDVVHLIDLQRSQSSSAGHLIFTVNLAVWVPSLAHVRAGRRDDPAVSDAQWRVRIGSLMPEHRDLWWTVTDNASALAVTPAVADALLRHGLPSLASLGSIAALVETWQRGECRGLTAGQCRQFAARLGVTLGDSAP